jgi:hypothetical protein
VVTREIDRVFGDCYAAAHPEVVVVVVQSAANRYRGWGASSATPASIRTTT